MNLRSCILGGLALSLFTFAITFGRILVGLPGPMVIVGVVTLLYSYAALREIPPRTSEDALLLQRGVQWGVAIGCFLAAGNFLGMTLGMEFIVLFAVLVLLTPALLGALTSIRSGTFRTGLRAGFWSGMVGGLIGFLAFAAQGFLRTLLSGAPVFSADHPFPGVMALPILFLYGPVYCPLAAAAGGWIGIRLEKTGRIVETAASRG